MENLLFSVSCVLPVFLVMLVGYCIKSWNILDENGFQALRTIAFRVGMPIMLFRDVAVSDVYEIFDLKWLIFLSASVGSMLIIIWLFAEACIKPRESIGAFVQGAYRSNFIILGASLVRNILGDSSASKVAMALAVIIPLYNILSIVVLLARSNNTETVGLKELFHDIVKNPMVMAIFAGVLFSLARLKLPQVILNPLSSIASIGSPITILSVGGALEAKAIYARKGQVALATFIKLIAVPLVYTPLAYLFGFRGDTLLITMIVFASPAAVTSYLMAKSMNADDVLAAGIVVLSTLLSVFTLTFGVFIFRTFGLF